MSQKTWEPTEVPARRTLSRFLSDKDDAGLSPSTVATYEKTVGQFIDWFGRDRDVNEISEEVLSAFLGTVKARGVSKFTQAHYMRHVKVYVRWLARKKYIEEIPHVTIPKTVRVLKTHLVTPDDMDAMLRVLDGRGLWDIRNMAFLSLLYDSGARVGEVLGLDATHVNIDARTAIVTGKGEKQRAIFFSHQTADLLDRYRRKVEKVASPVPFFVVNTFDRMTYNSARALLRRAKRESGVTCDVNPHNFRHSFATNFLRNGGDLGYLKELMGHSTFEVTKLYLSLDTADLMAAHGKFGPGRSDTAKKRRSAA